MWITLECPEGTAYVHLAFIAAIGPTIREVIGGITREFRLIYLTGGQGLAILDTPENMTKLMQAQGTIQ